jgi:WS/DGAT/MGAT family acyltransferase
LSTGDLLVLAADRHASVPMHIGALVVLDPDAAPEAGAVVRTLGQRAAAVPRLRQRLSTSRGRRGWAADPAFDTVRHLEVVQVVGSDAHLDALAEVVCRRLPRDRPLWRAQVLAQGDRASAVAIVLHHVLADGVGGLALLQALLDGEDESGALRADGPPDPPASAAPVTPVRKPRRSVVDGAKELGVARLRLAGRTSLVRPTGARRRVDVVEADLAAVRAGASRLGVTLNELVLVAVSGAVGQLLRRRRDPLQTLVVSVPVSARRDAGTADAGNAVGVVPVRIPLSTDASSRLAAISRESRRLHTGARGSSETLVAPAFRALARTGALQWFLRHQRLVHTFETNVRGPAGPLRLAGARVARVVPVAVNPGNITVSFDVLSAGGRLVISVVTDPVLLREYEVLRRALQDELGELIEDGSPVPASAHG